MAGQTGCCGGARGSLTLAGCSGGGTISRRMHPRAPLAQAPDARRMRKGAQRSTVKNAQLGTRAPAQTPQAQGALSSGAVSDPEQEVESPLRGAWHWDRRYGAQMTWIGD